MAGDDEITLVLAARAERSVGAAGKAKSAKF